MMPLSRSNRLAGLVQSDIRAMTRACERVGGINLGQGICDLPTPPLVRDGALQAIRERKSTYSYPEGILELRQAVARKLSRDNALQADPESQIVVTAGSSAAYTCALHALLNPGDGILLCEPYYGYHLNAALLSGLEAHYLSLSPPHFLLDEALLRSALRANTRAIVLCSPANPSGHMLRRSEIEAVARVASAYNLLVITDEIYEYIRYDDREHISPASVADLASRTVTIMGLSKTFSITGWRLGYAVAPAAMAQAIALVHDLFYICAPTPLQHGVAAGFEAPPAFFKEMQREYAEKRSMTCEALVAANLEPIVPEGAYYVLADVRRLGYARAKDAALALLEECGVAAVPGSAFWHDGAGEGYLRYCYAKETKVLAEACQRLRGLRA